MKEHVIQGRAAVVRVEDGRACVATPAGERLSIGHAVLSLTSRCNLDCVMCLDPAVGGPVCDLPLPEALRFVDEFGGAIESFWTSAGEPLLYPHFFQVAEAIRDRGSHLGLATNGLLLARPGLVERCQAAGVRTLHLSCHSHRPGRYAELVGVPGGDAWDRFRQALARVDAFNRTRPDRPLEVLLQVVLMKDFADEAEGFFPALAGLLPHTPLAFRIEPMQRLGRGSANDHRLLDVDALHALVNRVLDRHSPGLSFVVKSVPLCLLEGREHLSEDVRTLATPLLQVGNHHCGSSSLRLQCPVGDPATTAFFDTHCRSCSLVEICPGPMDIPVPPGSPWPRPSDRPALEVARRAGVPRDALRRHPLTRDGFPPPPPPPPAPGPGALTARQQGLVQRVLEALALAEPAGIAGRTPYGAEVRLPGEAGGEDSAILLRPADAADWRLFEAGGLAVGYRGPLTPRVKRCLRVVHGVLGTAEGVPG